MLFLHQDIFFWGGDIRVTSVVVLFLILVDQI